MSPIASLWLRHILPFVALVTTLGVLTVAGDALLHAYDLVWVGRYLGIPGTLLILASFIYSARKRKHLTTGNPKTLLRFHEVAAWTGSLLVLIHAGVHFNAILPWLATVAMGINVISGMVGKMLLGRSREHVEAQREHFQLRGLSRPEVEQQVFWDAVTYDAMTQWRKVHIPIFIVFATLAIGHIVSILLFWGWR